METAQINLDDLPDPKYYGDFSAELLYAAIQNKASITLKMLGSVDQVYPGTHKAWVGISCT